MNDLLLQLLTLLIGAVCVAVLLRDVRPWLQRLLAAPAAPPPPSPPSPVSRGSPPSARAAACTAADAAELGAEWGGEWEGWLHYLGSEGVTDVVDIAWWEEPDLLQTAEEYLARCGTSAARKARLKAALRDWRRRRAPSPAAASPVQPHPAAAAAAAAGAAAAPAPPAGAAPPAAPLPDADGPPRGSPTGPPAAPDGAGVSDGAAGDDLEGLLEGALDDMDAEENMVDQAWDKVLDKNQRQLSTQVNIFDMCQQAAQTMGQSLREQQERRRSERAAEETLQRKRTLQAFEFRQRGNKAFKARKYDSALEHYTRAIELSPEGDPGRHELWSNRAAALMGLDEYERALADAETCIAMQPSFAKGWDRKATALRWLGRTAQARAVFEQMAERFAEDAVWAEEARKGITACEAALKTPPGGETD